MTKTRLFIMAALVLLFEGMNPSPASATIYTVISTADSGAAGTLRWALTNADANPGSTIQFSLAPNSTITLASALPAINTNVTIDGSGSPNLSIDGSGAYQIFNIASGAVALSNLNLVNGNAASSGAPGDQGGAIYNSGNLVLTDVNVANGTANGSGGGSAQGGGIYQAGGGTLSINSVTQNNVFTGNNVTGANSPQGADLFLGANSTFNVANGLTYTLNSAGGPSTFGIAGTGGIVKTNSGTLLLSGDNGYSGGTSLLGGILSISNGNALGTGGLTLGGGTLQSAASVTLANNAVLTANSAIGGANNLTLTGTVGLGANSLAVNNSAATITLSGVVSGTGSVVENGSGGTLVLSGVNTYSGGTSILGGTLRIGSDSNLGNSVGNLYMSGGTLAFTNNAASNRTLNLGASGGTVDLIGYGVTWNGPVSGTGSLSVIDSSNTEHGILDLTGVNSYSGGTSVIVARLGVGGDANLGSASSTLTLDDGFLQTTAPVTFAPTRNLQLVGFGAIDTAGRNSSWNGVISGYGMLQIENSTGIGGTVTVTVTGNNTYTGGTVIIAATLNVNSDAALGDPGGSVEMNKGTLQTSAGISFSSGRELSIDAPNGCTFDTQGYGSSWNGLIAGYSGNSSLAVIGGGALTINSFKDGFSNDYSGGTSIGGGTLLNISADSDLGSASTTVTLGGGTLQSAAFFSTARDFVLTAGGTLDTLSNSLTVTGSITGTGGLTKAGSGTLALSSANSYTGGTALGAGVLNLANNNALGTGGLVMAGGTTLQSGLNGLTVSNAVSLAGNGTFNINSNLTTLSGIVSGPGGLAVMNSGSGGLLSLTQANSYTGGTDVLGGFVDADGSGALGSGPVTNSGNISFLNSYAAGSVTMTNNSGGSLVFGGGSTSASAGTAIILNNGFVSFQISSTASGAAITNNYHLGFQDSASAGDASIVNNDFVFFYNNSTAGAATITTNSGHSVIFENNSTGGTARLVFNGSANLDVSQETAASVTIGSFEGSGFVNLGAVNLAAGLNNLDTTFSGILADGGLGGGTGGSLTKIGTGTLVLTHGSLYTGGTDVEAGILTAANGLALGTGNVAVNSGTLQVSGPLTLAIGGNYTQGAGGTLKIGIGPSSTQWDKLHITGTATLAGTLSLVPYSGFHFHDNASMVILDATSVTGTFGTVTNAVNFGAVSVVYNPTDVVLDVTANAPSFASLGTTGNEKSIGGALDGLATSAPGSALVTYLDSQANSALPGIYDQLSPASMTPLYQMGFAAAQVEAGMVGQRLSQLFGDSGFGSSDVSWNGTMFAANVPASEEAATAKALEPQHWGVFANGMGNFGTVTGDSNATGYQYSIGGMVAGMDYRFSKSFAAGLLLGYSSSGTSQSTGTVSGTGGQAGLYGGWSEDSIHIEGLAEGGINNYTTQRLVLGATALGSPQGQEFSGQLSAGYDFKMDQVKVGPFVSGQYTSVAISQFTETGSLAPLSFGAQSEANLSSDLGATASRKWDLGGISLSPSISAAWEHVYQGNLDSLTANFSGGQNFKVSGPSTGTDAAVLGAGVNARLDKGVNAFVQYQGKLGLTNYASQSFSGGVNFGF